MLGASRAGQHGQVWAAQSNLNVKSKEQEDGNWENRGGRAFRAEGTAGTKASDRRRSSGTESRLTGGRAGRPCRRLGPLGWGSWDVTAGFPPGDGGI